MKALLDRFEVEARTEFRRAVTTGKGHEVRTMRSFASGLGSLNPMTSDGVTIKISSGFIHQITYVSYPAQQPTCRRELGDLAVIVRREVGGTRHLRGQLFQAKVAKQPADLRRTKAVDADQYRLYENWEPFTYTWGAINPTTRTLSGSAKEYGGRFLLLPSSLDKELEVSREAKMVAREGAALRPAGEMTIGEPIPFPRYLRRMIGQSAFRTGVALGASAEWAGLFIDLLARTANYAPRGQSAMGRRHAGDPGILKMITAQNGLAEWDDAPPVNEPLDDDGVGGMAVVAIDISDAG